MFRFYKISTFPNGTRHIDVGTIVDLATVEDELLQAPLAVGEFGGTFPRTVYEFLIYEG